MVPDLFSQLFDRVGLAVRAVEAVELRNDLVEDRQVLSTMTQAMLSSVIWPVVRALITYVLFSSMKRTPEVLNWTRSRS